MKPYKIRRIIITIVMVVVTTITIISIVAQEHSKLTMILQLDHPAATYIAYNLDGSLLASSGVSNYSASYSNLPSISVWNSKTGKALYKLHIDDGGIAKVLFTKDSNILLGLNFSGDLYRINTTNSESTIIETEICDFEYIVKDNQIVTTNRIGTISFFDLQNLSLIKEVPNQQSIEGNCNYIKVNTMINQAVIYNDKNIISLIDLTDTGGSSSLNLPYDLEALDLSDRGNCMAIAYSKHIVVYQVSPVSELFQMPSETATTHLNIDDTCSLLSVAIEDSVSIIDLSENAEVAHIEAHVLEFSFSPVYKTIALVNGTNIHRSSVEIWNLD